MITIGYEGLAGRITVSTVEVAVGFRMHAVEELVQKARKSPLFRAIVSPTIRFFLLSCALVIDWNVMRTVVASCQLQDDVPAFLKVNRVSQVQLSAVMPAMSEGALKRIITAWPLSEN